MEKIVSDIFQIYNTDIVYIGTIHTYHHETSLMLLQAGKNVLCEKPLGMNAREVKEMTDLATKKNVFFAEVGLHSAVVEFC